MVQFVAFGGALDPKRVLPPIGQSAYALIDWASKTALLVDYGARYLSYEERVKQSNQILSLLPPKQDFVEVEGQKIRKLPKLTSEILDTDETHFVFDNFPNDTLLKEMKQIFVVITHAHNDHCGALPFLKRQFPGVRIFLTKPTLAIAGWSWRDNLKIASRNGEPTLYSIWDIQHLEKSVSFIECLRPFEAGPYRVTCREAGHILGAVNVFVETPDGKNIFFTGDTSFYNQSTVMRAEFPSVADVLVSEATYAGHAARPRREVQEELVGDVEQCLRASGRVLCPSFAVGRSAELLETFREYGVAERFPVYLDGAACETASIYMEYGALPKEAGAHFIESPRERERIIQSDKPLVVIAPSGMLTGGYAIGYARAWIEEKANLIAFSSYQDGCSPGHRLLNIQHGSRIRFNDEILKLSAYVKNYPLSAHMDGRDLEWLIRHMRPQETFLVHGNESEMEAAILGAKNMHKTFLGESYSL